ncbi:MAG: type I 3-dehydroquinate dehydratase [Candidatus Heimdallarchaeota archaeon]|nr:type I 3-dehydroquinate dehydratase [Candidatus Heimdallarchaeota archaeon]
MICTVLISDDLIKISKYIDEAITIGTNIIEIRLDSIKELDLEKLKLIIDNIKIPLILSFRSEWYTDHILPPKEGRKALIKSLIEFESDYIDFEFPHDITSISKIKGKTRPIISAMDFDGVAKIDFNSLLSLAEKYSNAIIKISATPNRLEDLKQLWRWANKLNKEKIPHIVLGMGSLGSISRVKYRELGNIWTYGRLDQKIGEPYLPGMIEISKLKKASEFNSWHFGYIGIHSTSHFINYVLTKIIDISDVKGIVTPIPIESFPELDQLLLWINDGLLDGAYIAKNFQQEVITRINRKDISIIQTGICNVIVNKEAGITGYNSYISGIKKSISQFSIKKIKRIFIEEINYLTSSIIQCLYDSAEFIVIRTTKVDEFIKIKKQFPKVLPAEHEYSDSYDLVVNCYKPEKGYETVISIPITLIENASIVCDLESRATDKSFLIEYAEKCGKATLTEDLVLINTCIAAFELWTKKSISLSQFFVDY